LACVLAVLPAAGQALGLGNLRVLSTLNEPLSAEIDLTSVTERELKGLNVSLAPVEVYAAAGVERLTYLARIKFLVTKRVDGSYYLRLSSEEPFDEPFLHLLLQIEWPGTRLVREYTALIDLPTQVAGAPARVEVPALAAQPEPGRFAEEALPAPVATGAPREAPVAAEPKPESAAAEPARATERAPTEVAAVRDKELLGPTDTGPGRVAISPVTGWPESTEAAPPTPVVSELEPRAAEPAPSVAPRALEAGSTVGEYHVKTGDTLWEISERVRSDKTVAIEQVVMAIFRVNPDAFFGKNVNNLRAGKILRIPERDEVEATNVAEARREFRAQYDVWQEYKLKLAGASRALKVAEVAPAQPDSVPSEPAKPAPTERPAAAPAKKDAKAAPVKPGAEDELLKIVRAEAEGKKAKPDTQIAQTESPKDVTRREQTALGDRVSTLEESLVSKQLEAKELGDKIGLVREQLKREARLIELEKKDLAPISKKLEPPAPQPEAAKPAEPAKPPVVPEPPKAIEAPQAAAPQPPAAPAQPKPPVARKPAAPPAPPEKGVLAELADSVFGGELMPVLLGVVVLAAGAIGIVYMRRRRRSIAEFEESILSAEAVSRESASTTDATGQAVASGDTSFLSDFSQGGMGNIHTDEVDPIAEAEVYLAYGRDETAEEILKEAIVKNPQREELKVKLLEIYHQRNDVNAFETLAEELYAQTGGKGGKHWDKVTEMGRKLDPENPMFKGGKPGARPAAASAVAAAATAAPGMADTLSSLEAQTTGTTSAAAFGQTARDSETFDFDMGETEVAQAQATSADFDLDLGATEPASAAESIDFGATLKMDQPLDLGAGAARESVDSGLETLDFNADTQDNVIDFAPSRPGAPAAEPALAESDVALGALVEGVPTGAPATEEGGLQQWDETATKLDLAKAYIDMGDAEGARSILDEVLAEGNDQQKKQARDLVAQIG
jgi:pilus assembly protein FimV